MNDVAQQLVRYYHWLRRYGLNDSHSGNASARDGDRLWLTPTGACADTLTRDQLLACPLGGPTPQGASLDAALHLAVYRAAPDTAAVLHSHGPYTLALTFDRSEWRPPDFEGQLYFGCVPVLGIDYEHYLEESPERVAQALAEHPVVVVRGHGLYARGTCLELAYKWTCSLEHSAKTAWLARLAGTLP